LLEKALNEHSPSLRFEVLALGESGFGTADEYMRYLNFGVEYSPDLVLLVVTTANDIQDNSKFLSWGIPKFYDLTLPKRLFQSLKRRSYLASLISERLYLLRYELHKAEFEAHALETGRVGENRKLDEFSGLNIYLSNLSPRWQEAFEITKGLFVKFRASVEERGGKFAVVTNPGAEQVYPERAEQLNKEYKLAFDFEQPDRILAGFSRQMSITILQLMPVFRNFHLKTGTHMHGFGSSIAGHWNDHGHRLAADEIFKFLIEQRLVPIPGSTR
jgi:hypothetical protein